MSLLSRVLHVVPRGVSVRLPRWAGAGAEGIAAAAVTGLLCLAAGIQWQLPHPGAQAMAVPVAAVLYPLRRRHPVLVLVASTVSLGLLPFLGPVTAAALYTISRLLFPGRRRARLWALAAVAPVVTATVSSIASWTGPARATYAVALGLVLSVAAVVVPGLVGTVFGQADRLLEALRARADAAERARASADSEARTQERSRIAAEMHDLVGHRLSLASLHVGGLELALSKAAPALRPDATIVRSTIKDALRELRQALGVLDPLGVNTRAEAALTEEVGTRADIGELVAQSHAGGVDVALEWTGPDLTDVPVPVRRAVHRVVRESLTNVHRYAPGTEVTVEVCRDEDTVRVAVHNTAVSPGTITEGAGTGRGLPALRERVGLLNGAFTAGPSADGGFRLAADLPLRPVLSPATTRSDAFPWAGAHPACSSYGPVPEPAEPRRTRAIRTLVLGGGLAAVTALILVGIGFSYSPKGPQAPPEQPRIGMTLEKFHATGPRDSPGARAAAAGREPARPAAAAGCLYAFGPRPDDRPTDTLPLVRYCFDAHQRLTAIDPFTVPTVREAVPWESP
ncbi:sensor histidine kinase [Streptomyces sp. NPDC002669]|uniref:sensor histidine kinase n=1 Tax=Streptomyces sp. NPDC002669 TaxID=3364658 RepID=UPI00367B00A6